ncbi:MAG TPA: apolipoprotein N-acyltransferase [Burkholderiaceae bacterium]|nr:apolipoprotein N-acyltransferase [Burkholderiaceae bacterium]
MSSTPVNSIAPATQVASLGRHALRGRVNTACRSVLILLTISCAAGAALAFSHEHEALFMLAPVGIAAFLWAASVTSRRAFGFVLGFGFGLSCFATGLPWLFNLLDQRDAPLAAALLPALLIGALSMPTAIVGACVAGPVRLRATRLLLVAPAMWMSFDLLRHQGDVAFPWFSVGYSQVAASPLAGYAPIGGVLLVGFVTVLAGALIAVSVCRSDLRNRAAIAAVALFALGAALQHVPWTAASGTPLRVAVLQGNIGSAVKFDSSALSRTLARYESLIRSSQADVMLLPESALPLPAHALGGYLSALRKHAEGSGIDVLLGAFEVDADTGQRYSSAISLGTSGTQIYRKRHLVPFGDYVPWGAALYGSVQRIPFADTARGADDQPLPLLSSGRVAVAICYDDAFGSRIRADAAAAGWIANLSNDSWASSPSMQRQHARMAQARALEIGRPLLRAADTGRSGLIDERGRWVDSLPLNEVGALEARVVPRSGQTPYARWGDRMALVLCLLALLAAFQLRSTATNRRHLLAENFR